MDITRAAPMTAMAQIALQEVQNGKIVDWLEHVTDADYGATSQSPPA